MGTAGNPKAILFFTAVFPQFINPGASLMLQFSMLASSGCVIAFGCFMLFAVFGEKLVSLFSKAKVRKYINRIIGSTFVGMGLFLAGSQLKN